MNKLNNSLLVALALVGAVYAAQDSNDDAAPAAASVLPNADPPASPAHSPDAADAPVHQPAVVHSSAPAEASVGAAAGKSSGRTRSGSFSGTSSNAAVEPSGRPRSFSWSSPARKSVSTSAPAASSSSSSTSGSAGTVASYKDFNELKSELATTDSHATFFGTDRFRASVGLIPKFTIFKEHFGELCQATLAEFANYKTEVITGMPKKMYKDEKCHEFLGLALKEPQKYKLTDSIDHYKTYFEHGRDITKDHEIWKNASPAVISALGAINNGEYCDKIDPSLLLEWSDDQVNALGADNIAKIDLTQFNPTKAEEVTRLDLSKIAEVPDRFYSMISAAQVGTLGEAACQLLHLHQLSDAALAGIKPDCMKARVDSDTFGLGEDRKWKLLPADALDTTSSASFAKNLDAKERPAITEDQYKKMFGSAENKEYLQEFCSKYGDKNVKFYEMRYGVSGRCLAAMPFGKMKKFVEGRTDMFKDEALAYVDFFEVGTDGRPDFISMIKLLSTKRPAMLNYVGSKAKHSPCRFYIPDAWDDSVLSKLSAECIQALTFEEIDEDSDWSRVEDFKLATLDIATVLKNYPNFLENLSERAMGVLAAKNVLQTLSEEQLSKINSKAWGGLTFAGIRNVPEHARKYVTKEQMGKMNNSILSHMDADHLKGFDMTGWTMNQLSKMSRKVFRNRHGATLFTADSFMALTPEQVSKVSSDFLKSLNPDIWKVLGKEQMAAFPADALASLPLDTLKTIPADAIINGITVDQVNKLQSDYLVIITPEIFAAITRQDVRAALSARDKTTFPSSATRTTVAWTSLSLIAVAVIANLV